MSVLPIILVIGIDKSKSEDLIKIIIGDNKAVGNVKENDPILYIWRINNKYYSADVQFQLLDDKTSVIENIVNRVEAVILYIDHALDSLENELKEWDTVIHDLNTDVKILIFKHSLSEDCNSAVCQWCCNNEFELIELKFNTEFKTDRTSDDEEVIGVDRVIEALQTHQWSNLNLKKKTECENSINIDSACTAFKNINLMTSSSCNNEKPLNNSENPSADDEKFAEHMEAALAEHMEVMKFYQNLHAMKLKMESLSGTERLDQAEKLIKDFWGTINGDMDEFSDSQ